MKPIVFPRVLLGALLSIGLLTLGCSSSPSSPTTKADAGKKDTGASGGSGGSGGSSSGGGSSGSGGSSASGGASGSGGSGGSGGSSASGGSGGGTSASGGAGGLGGSSGSGGGLGGGGGSSGGTGGRDAGNTQIDGGGSVDAEASDALDAPILNTDGAASDETGVSSDGAVPIQLDTGAQDSEGVDSQAIDTMVVFLDAEAETSMVDAADDSAVATDTEPDPFACSSVTIGTSGNSGSFGSTGTYCFATCDDIVGWGGSNLDGRQVKVNGQVMTVPANGGTGGQMPLAAKVFGTYNLFQVTAGTSVSAAIDWWGTPSGTCTAPDGGFFP